MNCLLCGAKDTRFIFNHCGKDIYMKKLGDSFFRLSWFKCSNCGVYFSRQHKNIEDIYADKDLYDAQYDAKGIRRRFQKIMRLKESDSDNALRVKRVKTFHRQHAARYNKREGLHSVLDVGAGLGVFLAKFLDSNYIGEALEINKLAASHIKERLSIPVHTCTVEKMRPKSHFDLITLNKIIEHIKKPIGILRATRKILDPEGIIYIELPDSISYKLSGSGCSEFASGHHMVYNPESMRYLLKKSGFNILTMKRLLEPSGKRTIYAFAEKVC